MTENLYVFKKRTDNTYWVCKGKTTENIILATKFDEAGASRFYRTVAHPNKWKKELYVTR